MKHVIVTSSDINYGDFLVDHWYASLKENVDLSNIDVVVLDYGLSVEQKSRAGEVKFIKCKRDGNVTSLRYRDLLKFLNENKHDQVLMVDGGDIIFQKDISHLFEENKAKWRGVEEDTSLKFDHIYQFKIKDKALRKKVIATIESKRFINGGFILASADNFVEFCKFYLTEVKDLSSYGVDQALITYFMLTHPSVILDRTYNFMIISNFNTEGYKVKGYTFYKNSGELIHVVHNPGKNKFIRGMAKFGYKVEPKLNFTIYISKLSSQLINGSIELIVKLTKLFSKK
jgi:hypothetical protein